jgi:arylsulfatase A-like enzyme
MALARSRTVRDSALQGLAAGTAFAAVECLFSSVIEPVVSPYVYTALDNRAVVLPFVAYPVLLGSIAGICGVAVAFMNPSHDQHRARVTDVVVRLAMIVVFLAATPLLGDNLRIGLAAVGAFALLATAASSVSARAFRVVGGMVEPWALSVLLVGSVWLSREILGSAPVRVKALACAALAAVLWAATLLFQRVMPRGDRTRPRLAIAAAVAILTSALVMNHDQLPMRPTRIAGRADARRPNVVIVTMDTVRADHLSVYGYQRNTSQNLVDFSRVSTAYSRAISTSNATLPAHESMFTGAYASLFGDSTRIPASFPTMSQLLAGAGYRTMSVVANYGFFSTGFDLGRGFQYHDARPSREYLPRNQLWRLLQRERISPFRRAPEIESNARVLIRSAAHSGENFFLFVNYMDAHAPYASPRPYSGRFSGRDDAPDMSDLLDRLQRDPNVPHPIATPAERQYLMSQYDGGIAYVDASLARLLGVLRSAGVYDNSLIVITADHGEAFDEHGCWGHGYSLFQEQIHIPLLVKFPRQGSAATSTSVVSLADIFPTVLNVTGVSAPSRSGVDLRSSAAVTSSRAVLSELFRSSGLVDRAAVSPALKVIMLSGRPHAYALDLDPAETADVIRTANPVRIAELIGQISLVHAPPGKQPGRPDSETIERLRSLGYLR